MHYLCEKCYNLLQYYITNHMVESKKELKSLLMKVNELA